MSVERQSNILLAAAAVIILYAAISMTAYAFRHPEQTRTQITLNIIDALFWK